MESIDTSDAFACPWRLDKANLPTDMRVVEVSELTYPISMKDMQMSQIDSHSVFILMSALSTGISLDCSTGEISGTISACTLTAKKINSFALHTGEQAQRYGFSVYGRYESVDEYTSMLFMTDPTLLERDRKAWPVPVDVAGFKQLKFEVNAFCKSWSTGWCPAMGEYPSVGEGEISPAGCPEGFHGYAYRECHDGVLGEVKMDKVPDRLQYENNNMVFVME
ncbi:hypothetical protein AV274_3920 [Blastocystis sp. ATCC 50177/Nand II]|uniref:Uncharacterized protein n=1 Tax=Blastocystis sp. subtype 1 (strain ATCC 50177 / NandII) TaxID=478820 RepID=A0A196SE19_BLAHN|nr:hypothetical protein AV274_3920 [Blastocystis sp. ATCC 50177/Nand II]